MEVKIEPNFQANAVKVWFWDADVVGQKTRIYYPEARGNWRYELHSAYAAVDAIPPSLELPTPALEALVAAAEGHVTASDATVDALKDTRVVRDRLLTLVERLAPTDR